MFNSSTQEMIISTPHTLDLPWEEGMGLTGLSKIKPSVYKTWLKSSDPRQDVQGVLQEVLAFTEL